MHTKPGKPDSLRVDYYAGLLRCATEWVCLFHGGGAQVRAERWWSENVPGVALPADVHEAVEVARVKARAPAYLYIQNEGKYERIVSRGFGEDMRKQA
jgi:hypothetical protein